MNHIKCIILFMLKLCNLNRWKCVRQLNNIKCKFRPNHFFFCVEDVVPTKTIRIYPNQKPWINSDVRSALSARTSAFKSGNTDDRKQASYDLRRSIKAAKQQYKNNVEEHFNNNNPRSMWQGINNIAGFKGN